MSTEFEKFSKDLSDNSLLLLDFVQFLQSVKRQRSWTTAGRITRDQAVQERYPKNPDSFRRMFDRIVNDGAQPSARTLGQIADVLFPGPNNTSKLLEKFDQWARDRVVAYGDRTFSPEAGIWVMPTRSVVQGSKSNYAVVRRIPSSGNVAESYEVQELISNTRYFAKTLRLLVDEPPTAIADQIDTFQRLYDRERQNLIALGNLRSQGHFARFIDFCRVNLRLSNNCTVGVPFLVQSFLPGDSLVKLRESGEGFRDPKEWRDFAWQLLSRVNEIHDAGVVHADIYPENLLWYKGHLSLIDFGESAILSAAEAVHPSIGRMHPSRSAFSKFRAPERRAHLGRPLDPREDLYAVAATLIWAASDTFDEDKLEEIHTNYYQLQDFVQRHVGDLVGQNAGISMLLAQCLRARPEDRPDSVALVLAQLRSFERMGGNPQRGQRTLRQEAEGLVSVVESLPVDSFFYRVLDQDIRATLKRARDMAVIGRCDISGPRDVLINGLLGYMAEMKKGSSYTTLTRPVYWTPGNLGLRGRFMAANTLLAKNGVFIRRIIAVGPEDITHHLEHVRQFIDTQRQIADEMCFEQHNSAVGGYFVGVVPFRSTETLEIAIAGGRHIGIIQQDQQVLSLSFEESAGIIKRVTVWRIDDREVIAPRIHEIDALRAESIPIHKFILTQQTILDYWGLEVPAV